MSKKSARRGRGAAVLLLGGQGRLTKYVIWKDRGDVYVRRVGGPEDQAAPRHLSLRDYVAWRAALPPDAEIIRMRWR